MPVFYLLHGEEYNSNGIYYKSYDVEEIKEKRVGHRAENKSSRL
jgi:hypothetical protein